MNFLIFKINSSTTKNITDLLKYVTSTVRKSLKGENSHRYFLYLINKKQFNACFNIFFDKIRLISEIATKLCSKSFKNWALNQRFWKSWIFEFVNITLNFCEPFCLLDTSEIFGRFNVWSNYHLIYLNNFWLEELKKWFNIVKNNQKSDYQFHFLKIYFMVSIP